MAKQDLSQLKETAVPNTRSKEKLEREKALKALDEAKKIPRTVVFLKKGEGDFTRSHKKEQMDFSVFYTGKEVAQKFGLTLGAIMERQKKYKIPFKKIKGRNYFKKEIVEKHFEEHPVLRK